MILTFLISIIIVLIYWLSFSYINNLKQCGRTHTKLKTIIWFIPLITITLLVGLRDNVGMDYISYANGYKYFIREYSDFYILGLPKEFLFSFISKLLREWNVSIPGFFCVMAFIPFFFLGLFLKENEKIATYIVFFMMSSGVLFLYMNIMRQGISFFILLYGTKYIINGNLKRFLFIVFIASGFHTTAFLFAPCYLLRKIHMFTFNKYALLIVYLLSCFFNSFISVFILSNINTDIIFDIGYNSYSNTFQTMEIDKGSGLGVFAIRLIDLILIFTSYIIYYKKSNNKLFKIAFNIYFGIYFIGAILWNIGGYNMLLNRLPFALVSMRIVVLSIVTFCCFKQSKQSLPFILGISLILISIATFLGNVILIDYKFV